jgi:hypothetical protein
LVLTTQLGLPSPLEPAVSVLKALTAVNLARSAGTQAVTRDRDALARAIATGEREFDDKALREWAAGGLWVADGEDAPASASLGSAVARAAQREAVQMFVVNAAEVFSTVATAVRDEIAKLEALPKPPRGLWAAADPTRLLVRSEGHAQTLSNLAAVTDKFWILQRVADVVRQPAGEGFERYPDGAPRDAAVYRNWRKALAEEDAMVSTHRSMWLWREFVDGWEPGIWRAADIETTARTARSRPSSRFGSAVGFPSGHPA